MNREGTDQLPFSTWITRPQMLVGLSALLLSLCGLFIAIYEASLIRQAQRASVWPYVEVAGSINPDGIKLWVQNTGVGPARIRAAAVTYQGETQTGWLDLVRSVVGEDSVRVNVYQSLIDGRVLPSDSPKETFFEATEESGAGTRESIALLRDAIFEGMVDVVVCYCSVYEECWTSSLQDMVRRTRGGEIPSDTREVDGCDAVKRSGI